MLTTKKADALYNANPFVWSVAKSEAIELIEEIKNRNMSGIVEEFTDTVYATSCAFYKTTGINIPILMGDRMAQKIEERFVIWRKIFTDAGLTFDKKYLVNGSNHQKEHKIKMALDLARMDQLGDA